MQSENTKMIKPIELTTWDDFQKELAERFKLAQQVSDSGYAPDLLFRGQGDATWKLTTTLERWGCENMALKAYHFHAFSVKTKIESYTNYRWSIPTPSDYEKTLTPAGIDNPFPSPFPGELYNYSVYLRHHGFPSPLLDWTKSPYIAAYFAFSSLMPDQLKEKKIAIYAYQDDIGYKNVF